MKTTAIIPAAGSGTRMGQPKQFLMLGDMPVLAHTLRAFSRAESVDEVIVADREEDILLIWDMVTEFSISKVSKIVNGGETRTDSVRAAFREVADNVEIIAIHDGARPFVTPRIIQAVVEKTYQTGAAIVATRLTDTLKKINADGQVETTLDRNAFWRVQTPQGFSREIILEAYAQPSDILAAATDDSMLVERLGYAVHVVEGEAENFKITTPFDFVCAEALSHSV